MRRPRQWANRRQVKYTNHILQALTIVACIYLVPFLQAFSDRFNCDFRDVRHFGHGVVGDCRPGQIRSIGTEVWLSGYGSIRVLLQEGFRCLIKNSRKDI